MAAWSPGSAAERRARLASRHHLAASARAGTAAEAAQSLIALHGTDPASVYLAVWARTGAVDSAAISSVQAAWIVGARPAGTTNMVRRMPSIRTSACCS